MHEITIVRQRADCVGRLNRHIVRLHSVLWHNHAHLQIVRISIKLHVQCHLMHTEISTIPYNHCRAKMTASFQPFTKICTMKGIERILGDDLVVIGKRQIFQLRNSVGFACSSLAVRWKIGKLNRIGWMSILRQNKFTYSNVVGAIKRSDYCGNNALHTRAG